MMMTDNVQTNMRRTNDVTNKINGCS